jgi:MFS family permease
MAPVATRDLGVSPAAVGYYIAVAYAGSMIGSAAAGGWVARFGPIRVSQVALALCLAGLGLAASAWTPLVLVGAFVCGLGYGPTNPASSVILVRAAPPAMYSLTFSIKQTGVPGGGVLAGAIVPALVLAVGWQWGAIAIGAACLALAIMIAPVRARYDVHLVRDAPVSPRTVLDTVALVVSHRRLREMCVTSFVYAGVQITLVTYLVTFLVDGFAVSLVLAGAVMAVAQAASVLGRLVWGVLADRALSRRAMLGLLGLGMGASAMATLAASPDWPLWLLFAFASGFGATAVGWNGVFLAEVARVAPQGRVSQATGGCLFFTFLGVVLTPLVFNGLLALGAGYPVAYALLGVPGLVVGARLLARRPA